VDRVAGAQPEGRDLDIEMIAGGPDHLVRAAHHAGRRLERTPRRILERFAGREQRLRADIAGSANFLR